MSAVPTATRQVAAAFEPFQEWDGTTYYGREQLKPAPFEPWVVGGYIFLAGLSGSASILATLADVAGRPELEAMVRRGRYLALLAPTIGSALLVYDLHTPKRFYNMLRVAKATSPMSIGTWILMSFSGFAGAAALGQAAADRWPEQTWLRRAATVAGVPAALAGAGLSTYTASLLSATSTPIWAAAPRSLAIRFGSSSIATGAAALALGESNPDVRARLDAVEAAALAVEATAASTVKGTYRRKGVDGAMDSPAGRIETIGATALGVALPLGLIVASAVLGRRPRTVSIAASLATLAGSAVLRTSMLSLGHVSASRPDVSFRFSTPRNLPDRA